MSTSLGDRLGESGPPPRAPLLPRAGGWCLGAALAGTAVILTGWALQIRWLAAPIDGSNPMKLNTALALFALTGSALQGRCSPARSGPSIGIVAVGVACFTAGALTLLQYLTSTSFGLDELLRSDPWSVTPLAPGRPAPQAAVAVMCIAAAMLVPSRGSRPREALVLAALVPAALGIVGHVFAVDPLVTVGSTYRLPVETSVVLMLLGLGVLLTSPPGPIQSFLVSDTVGGGTFRRLLVPVLALPLAGAALDARLQESGAVSAEAAIWSVGLGSMALAMVAIWFVAQSTEELTLRGEAEHARYEELFDSVPDGLYETSIDGSLLLANDPLAHLLAYADAKHLLSSVSHVQDLWVDPAERQHLIDRIEAGQTTGALQVVLRRRDATHVIVGLSYRAVTDRAGATVGLRGTIRDVTADVGAQQALTESQAQYRLAFENGPLGRLVLDLSTPSPRFSQVNQALTELLGFSAEELYSLDPLSLLHPDDVGPEVAEITRIIRGGKDAVSYATRRRHKTGDWIPVWLRGNLVRDAFGVPRYAMATMEDRRPRLAAEAETARAWRETLRRLATAVEYRDEETGGHVERMSAYCELIARHLGIDADRAAIIRTAAQLHDAGKIAIPDHILLKPGRLTPEERQIVQSHADIGHELLAGSGHETLDLAASIAWTHHERYDGHGYPRGLKGEQIPLEARIATVADVFDALTSERAYRQALPLGDALAIMRDARNAQFDPGILDTFLAHIDEALAIQAAHREDLAANVVPFPGARGRHTSRWHLAR